MNGWEPACYTITRRSGLPRNAHLHAHIHREVAQFLKTTDFVDFDLHRSEGRTCYTQSEGWFDTARTDCSVSSIHPTSGVVLNFPSPARYLMFGFAGNTNLWEVELGSCLAA